VGSDQNVITESRRARRLINLLGQLSEVFALVSDMCQPQRIGGTHPVTALGQVVLSG
jgi:hypothetical protein